MTITPKERILISLTDLIDRADDGARLPTVRHLMRQYGVGQAAVQDALTKLKTQGLIASQIGSGSFVTKTERGDNQRGTGTEGEVWIEPRSLLILSNSSMNERCVLVQNKIMGHVQSAGGKVVQMSYHDTDHLLGMLKPLPTFDAIILQSHYEVIPVRLLMLLQKKTRALVLDGHTVAGVDIDRMGIDWEFALSDALDHLVGYGHRNIGLISLDSQAQPILSVRRLFERLDNWRGSEIVTKSVVLTGLKHPTQTVASAMSKSLGDLRRDDGSLSVSALICVGISDGMGIRQVLRENDVRLPDELSLVILGHPDVPTEHLGMFTIVGGHHTDGATALMEVICKRLTNPKCDPQIVYLDCHIQTHVSSGPAQAFAAA